MTGFVIFLTYVVEALGVLGIVLGMCLLVVTAGGTKRDGGAM